MTRLLPPFALLLSLVLPLPVLAQEAIDETRGVSANERIDIEVARGEVRIRPGTDAVFRVRGTLDEEAEGYVLESGNGYTRFEVEMPRRFGSRLFGDNDEGSRLEIEVPVNAVLTFVGVNVDVDVAGIYGSSTLSTVNGNIAVSDLRSFVTLNTVNGRIRSQGLDGRVEISTVNGEIDDTDSRGRLTLSSVNGEIASDSQATELAVSTVNGEGSVNLTGTAVLEMSTVNGDLVVRLSGNASPRVDGSTVSGDLTLFLPADLDASFDLEANAGGDIHNRLTDAKPSGDRYGPRERLNFTLGAGTGSIEFSTISGDITIGPL